MRYNTNNPVGTDGSTDPRDLYDNSGFIDLFANSPLPTVPNRFGTPNDTIEGVKQKINSMLQSTGLNEVTAQADRAEAAADSAFLTVGVKSSLEDGLASVNEGEFFQVLSPAADEWSILYKKEGGLAVEEKRIYYTQALLKELVAALASSVSRPNLFTVEQLNGDVLPVSINATLSSKDESDGNTGVLMSSNGTANIGAYWRFNRADFIDNTVSAGLSILSANAGTSGSVTLVQRNASGTTISSTNLITGLSQAITAKMDFYISNLTLDAACAFIDLRVELNDSTTLNRQCKIAQMFIQSGKSRFYTQPDVRRKLSATLLQVDNVATGLALAVNNQYFSVIDPSNGDLMTLYKKIGGMAVEQSDYISDRIFYGISESLFATLNRPNLINKSSLLGDTLPGVILGSASKYNSGGVSGIQILSPAGGQSDVYWRVNRSDVVDDYISVAIDILSSTAGSSGRLRLIQRDSSLTMLSELVITEALGAAINEPQTFKAESISLLVNCSVIELRLAFGATGGARTSVVNKMVIRSGASGSYENPDLYGPEVQSLKKSFNAQIFKNQWPDPMFKKSGNSFNWDMGAPTAIVEKNGFNCIETPSSEVAINRRKLINVSAFKSGRLSVSMFIHEKIGDQGATGLQIRLTAHASNSVGTLMPGAWAPYSGNETSSNDYYSKLIPRTDITSAYRLVICEDFQIPQGATHIGLDVRIQTNVKAYISHIVFCEGPSAAYSDNYDAEDIAELKNSTTSLSCAYVSSGIGASDLVGVGTKAQPYATITKALQSINGHGIVHLDGEYFGANQKFDPALVKGSVIIYGSVTNGKETVIRLSDKLLGISKTEGRTKVYQVTTAAVTNTPNWIYQDGVNDNQTLIPASDREPEHNGRTHRLYCVKIVKATATTLVDALSELDSSPIPKCFYSAGVLYFTCQDGADGSAADIYIDSPTGLITAGGFMVSGHLELKSLDLRYGGLNTRSMKSAHLASVKILGSRFNAWDYAGSSSFSILETSCSGSATTDGTGDGVNGHNYSDLVGHALYSHDNMDDGESTHEWGRMRLYGGYFEFNGGTAVAPAYGCDAKYYDVKSRRNQQILGRKPGAFAVIGDPTDGGVDTLAHFIRCKSISDRVSFYDNSQSTQAKAVCIDCESINPLNTAYDIAEIKDCSHIGTGLAKTPKVVVSNRAIVI